MTKYVIKRIGISILVFLGITLLVYLLVSMTPGSPAELFFGEDFSSVTPEKIAAIEEKLGLNDPVLVRYGKWLLQLFQGNFGKSYRTSESVLSMVLTALGPTLILTISSIVISVLIALPLGMLAAYKPYSFWDYVSSGISFFGSSVPNFFTGLIMMYIFAVTLKMLPVSGMYDTASNPTIGSLVRHLICPVTALVLQQIGFLLRQTRGSMLESLNGDYIRTCRAAGQSEIRVILNHGLRNALIPLLTVLSGKLPFIVGGAVITEQIFSWPGLGSLMVRSINNRDYPCIMGITVFIAGMVLIGNILLDIAYGLADPRIRHSRSTAE